MGCDIHMWVEHRVNGVWTCLKAAPDEGQGRNYQRFAALAGVRGDGPEALGLPNDVSEEVLTDHQDWGSDGHSASWMLLPQALKIFMDTEWRSEDNDSDPNATPPPKKNPVRGQRAKDDAYTWFDRFPGDYYFGVPIPDDNYRIVFWFDN